MIKTGDRRSWWQKYVSIEVPNYNIFYQASIASEPRRVFYGVDIKLGIRPQETPIITSHIEQNLLDQTEMTKMLCTPISKLKLFTTKMSTLQNSKKQVMCMSYSHNQTINWVEILLLWPYIIRKVLQNNSYLVPKTGTKKKQVLHRIRLRQFTPDNLLPMNKSRQRIGNLIWKWAINTMIWMLEHEHVTKKGQFSTPSTITRRHPIHPQVQCDLIRQEKKRGTQQETQESVPLKFFPNGWVFWRKRHVFPYGTWCGNEIWAT